MSINFVTDLDGWCAVDNEPEYEGPLGARGDLVSAVASAVSADSYKLPPLGVTFPFVFDCRFSSPFARPLRYRLTYGHQSSPVITTPWIEVTVGQLNEAWARYSEQRSQMPNEPDQQLRFIHAAQQDFIRVALGTQQLEEAIRGVEQSHQ